MLLWNWMQSFLKIYHHLSWQLRLQPIYCAGFSKSKYFKGHEWLFSHLSSPLAMIDLRGITLLPNEMCLSKFRFLKDSVCTSELVAYNCSTGNEEEVILLRKILSALKQVSKISNSSPKEFFSHYLRRDVRWLRQMQTL